MWDFQNIFIRPDTMTIINKRFNLNAAYAKLKLLLEIWEGESSGWIIDEIQDIHINVNYYVPLAGSSCNSLPKELNNSMKGLINLKNEDNKCFKWCPVIFLHPQDKDASRIKKDR